MPEPFIGEIRAVGFPFTPAGWAACDGQLLPIAQNTQLFSLLGVAYGGDGRTTFALPDLRGRVPVHRGQGPGLTDRPLGSAGGAAAVTLNQAQMPAHTHTARAASQATTGSLSSDPGGHVWGVVPAGPRSMASAYQSSDPTAVMSPAALATAGESQPHNNMQPYLGLYFIIALQGVYPSRP